MGLPVELTRLVGRDAAVDELRRLLGHGRLVTLAGPGGSGKTRLALRVASDSAAGFPDGVWWVELASLEDPELVPERIAAALCVPETPGRPVTASIIDHLLDRHCLVVLDNCEHLVASCASIADRLLRAAPGLVLLATSREPLGVGGETTWPVPPLALPDLHGAPSVRELLRCPSVELFVERATAAHPGFATSDADIVAVAQMCRRLDGIPLAIELAAARVRVMSPRQIFDRLGEDLLLLADRGRSTVSRHRTLLATMDWSYELLTAEEKRLFRALAVFTGGFGLEAAEAVGSAGPIPAAQVLDLQSGLVEKSLVIVDHGAAARYRMLETVRHYAAAKLDAAGEAAGVRAAHADFFVALAQTAGPGLLGPDQRDWVIRLSQDHDNITAALGWLYERRDALRGLDLAGRLGRFWWFAGQFAEGAAWIEVFLSLPGAQRRSAERARALHALGLATFWHESPAAGVDASRCRFEEAVEIYRELGDDHALAAALRDLGGYWKGRGDPAIAHVVLEESIAIAERIGDDCAAAAATAYLGILASYKGELDRARALLERSLPVLHERGGADDLIRCVFFLACLDCDAGYSAAARARFKQLITKDVLTALPYTGGFALDGLARLAAAEGQPQRAMRMAGAARAAHERVGTSAGPAYDEYVRRGLEPTRRLLDQAVADREHQRGRALSLDDAVDEGLRPPPGRRPTEGSGDLAVVLSAREAEVLNLAAEGLADAEIATALHLSRRTVGNHLGSAYRKLGVGSRTAAIRAARLAVRLD
jgi:predicted ATPase/DNA-binding CsgD family transcriptional regulator